MQLTPELAQKGFLTHTTLGSLGIDPNLDEKSVKVTCFWSDVCIELDKRVSHHWPLESHPLMGPVKPSPDRLVGDTTECLSCLFHCVKVAPRTETLIIRLKDSEPVAVFETQRLDCLWRRHTFYIIGF